MSKLVKRLRKNLKNYRNCVILGNGFEFLEPSLEIFNNVFVFEADESIPKNKKVIKRENYESLDLILDVDLILIGSKFIMLSDSIKNLIKRHRSMIYIGLGEFLDQENTLKFRGYNYDLIEITKSYQIWRSKE
jgi:hypothetical protein